MSKLEVVELRQAMNEATDLRLHDMARRIGNALDYIEDLEHRAEEVEDE